MQQSLLHRVWEAWPRHLPAGTLSPRLPAALCTSTWPRAQCPEHLCSSGPGLVAERGTETVSVDLLCCCMARLPGGGLEAGGLHGGGSEGQAEFPREVGLACSCPRWPQWPGLSCPCRVPTSFIFLPLGGAHALLLNFLLGERGKVSWLPSWLDSGSMNRRAWA